MGVFTAQGANGKYARLLMTNGSIYAQLHQKCLVNPEKNRILGYLLSCETDFESSKNFVFLPKSLP